MSCGEFIARSVLQFLPKGRTTFMRHLLITITLVLAVMSLTKGMRGGDPNDFQYSYLVAFFASATAFISGIVLFFAVAVRTVFSSLHD
jgi:hypothetical protein